ncbi:MAG TPA: hypothetical protein VGP08_24805 [Pyrinomonadaceae bacterium]|jgi:hypothetical protein|nr:hypothetical protein [Pyrinomonadaceae bacterium]
MTDERFIIGENGIPRPNPALPGGPPEQEPERFAGEPFARRAASYLLGEMSEEESERFEDECFEQRSWPSQIALVEEELIDAYLHDEMPAEQRRLFEQNYLMTEARQERVSVAATLLRRVCRTDGAIVETPSVTREGGTWAGRLKAFWGGRAWGLREAAAAAAIVILVGGAWLYFSRTRPPRVVATLKLTGNVINRSGGAAADTVKLPPDADALRVILVLPERATPVPRYRAELENEDGETVPLPAEGQEAGTVSVLIPASSLPRGQYALMLFAVGGDGQEQPVYGTYTFIVD